MAAIGGLLIAILTGALVFGLYAIGVNTLDIHPQVTVGTIVVVVISAVGAYLGNLALLLRSARADA